MPLPGPFYLCGPAGFMGTTTSGLREQGVLAARIRTELFGPAAMRIAEHATRQILRFSCRQNGNAEPALPRDSADKHKPPVLTLKLAKRTTNKKALVNHEGLSFYFDFCDEDLMRSSSFKNSAVSSSIDLEGGFGGKGITSDMGRTSLGTRPRRIPFSPAIAAFLRRTFFRWLGSRHNSLMRTVYFLTALIVAGGTINAAATPLSPFRYEAQAQRHCPDDAVVWLDFRKGIYYFKRQNRYGQGNTGSFVCREEARSNGYRRSLLGLR